MSTDERLQPVLPEPSSAGPLDETIAKVPDAPGTVVAVSAQQVFPPPAPVAAYGAAPAPAAPVPAGLQRRTTLPPGQLMEGRFKILRMLGKGAMGAVYLAEDQTLGGPPIVLKLMTARGAAGAADHELFRREVLSARSVMHPNVVRVFDYHVLGGVPAITMEYLSGGTLNELRKHNPSVVHWLHLLAEVADALQAVHAAGIIHRDLKPENILLGEDGRPHVTDFGIARRAASADESFQCYTPMYAAPEQIRDEKLNTKADIYAFGAMAFHLLSGQPPFPREATLEGHLSRPPPSLTALVPDLPATVEQLIHRCMAKEPGRRPDAETLSRQLRDASLALEPAREASVLRIDLVAFPTWATQHHTGALHALTDILAEFPIIKGAGQGELLKLPLRDGVMLVFLRSAEAAFKTALGVATELHAHELAARMGIHHGSVKMVTDLTGRRNAVGGAVGVCEHIMAFGTAGHLLMSDRFRTVLMSQAPSPRPELQGPFQVVDATGTDQRVWNYHVGEIGQPFVPPETPVAAAPKTSKASLAGGMAAAAVVLMGGAAVLFAPTPASNVTAPPVNAAVVVPAPTPDTRPTKVDPVHEPQMVAVAAPVPTPSESAASRKAPVATAKPRAKGRETSRAESATAVEEPRRAQETPTPVAVSPVAPAPAKTAPAPAPTPAPQPAAAPAPSHNADDAKAAMEDASKAMRSGEYETAAAKANAALKLDGRLSAAHKVLGMAYARLKRHCESKVHYQKYLTANPTAENAPGVRKALEAKEYAGCP